MRVVTSTDLKDKVTTVFEYVMQLFYLMWSPRLKRQAIRYQIATLGDIVLATNTTLLESSVCGVIFDQDISFSHYLYKKFSRTSFFSITLSILSQSYF